MLLNMMAEQKRDPRTGKRILRLFKLLLNIFFVPPKIDLNNWRVIDLKTEMEKRLNKKIESYITTFKDAMRAKIAEIDFEEKSKMNDLIEYVYEYERLALIKDDLNKRKRVKNSIPCSNRCSAKRANGEQCTRRRKDGCEFCGTHAKGTPNGLMNSGEGVANTMQKVQVVAEEIGGIVYYVDAFNNVYKTEDVMEEKPNPEIIAKYVLDNGKYTIPAFGLV